MIPLASCSFGGDGSDDAARAQSLLQQNRIAEARTAIAAAINARDDNVQYHLLRGRIEYAAGSADGAYDAFSNALALDPNNMEALLAVSQIGLQTGHLKESLTATEAILALVPDQPDALLIRGLHALIRSRYDEADDYADKILAAAPNNEGGAILKARVSFLKGNPELAIDTLAHFSKSAPDTIGIARTKLEIYRQLRDAKEMEAAFRSLRKLTDDNIPTRIDEANFAFKTGRVNDALALTQSTIANPRLSNEETNIIVDLWREYGVRAPDSKAIAALAAEGTRHARFTVARFLISRRHDAAAAPLLTALPETDRTALQAEIAALQNDMTRAEQLAGAVLKQDATHCLALTVQARARMKRNDAKGALTSAQNAASQCPSAIDAWELAALAYSRQQDDVNARRMFQQGMSANRQNPEMAKAFIAWLNSRGAQREALTVARRLTRDAPALMTGWHLYLTACAQDGNSCTQEAQEGLKDASTRYGIDPAPGEPAPNGLFGRLTVRKQS